MQVAVRADFAANIVTRIERGRWVAVHNLFAMCLVLGLRIAQTVPVQFARRSRPDED